MSDHRHELIEGLPPDELMGRIVRLNNTVFGFGEQVEGFKQALGSRRRLLFCLAFDGLELVGFKVGYEERPGYFESWRGGVLPAARGRGIAGRMMELQHAWCVEQGFAFINTVCNNHNTDMLRLNMRHGLLITGSHVDRGERLKLVLQKDLRGLPV